MNSGIAATYDSELGEAFQAFAVGKTDEAIERAEAARRLKPDAVEPLFVLALAAFKLNDIGAAIRLLETAHRTEPDGREIVEALAAMHGRAGNLSESLYYTKLAFALDENPRLAGLLPKSFLDFEANIAQARQSAYIVDASIEFFLRRFDKAADLCRRELQLHPDSAEAHRWMGRISLEIGHYEEASEHLEYAARVAPHDPAGYIYWAEALRKQGRLESALDCCREAVRLDSASSAARCQLLMTLAYMPAESWRMYAEEAKAAVTAIASKPSPGLPVKAGRKSDAKIHIGFLVNETVMVRDINFFESFLVHYDSQRFFVRIYQQYSRPFSETSRLQGEVDDWRPVYNIDDETLAFIIGNDNLDVLVDMCGAGVDGRQALLALRPTPVQIGWLGFPQGCLPGTADWIVSDGMAEECDARDSGGIAPKPLDGGQMAYLGASVEIEDATESKDRPPAVINGYVTFGAILDPARIAGSAPIWARVLREIPDARLVLGRAPLPDEGTRRRLLALFDQHGLGDRIIIQDAVKGKTAAAAFYTAIDILLDSLPVNGTMELCEALWRGVPVITCRGDRHVGRIGASILAAAGRTEWIAETLDQFVMLARQLASNLSMLAALRRTLPDEFKKGHLCDGKRFAAEFGALIERLAAQGRAETS
jgi:predicted O-linked N-acetylglucosamine transferase (SPINDLY family)